MRTVPPLPSAGLSLVEVLVTVVVLAFGLLGIAALQAKVQVGSIEAYQRAQAVVLVDDMRARILGNPAHAADYVTETPLGKSDTQPADCTTVAVGTARDQCEWSQELKGAAEQSGAGTATGAMIDARGCVEQLQAPDPAAGVCKPGIYRVSVAWQGLHPTRAPGLACGANQYGADDANRRAIAVQLAIGLPSCI
ncbi:type IV pilus modification protein PilV [Telluria mixta]|uniref:Type IV pilus modification protein PilV n=1 Tax=Telluria mixta TaxID=34071 RepID=A0ABT2BZL9_9BURK|nr:type IV pilus modification protein PilV [Telluria mixta]MCS0630392.1 type IV pilus modification protein PilV [Telluria mixta]